MTRAARLQAKLKNAVASPSGAGTCRDRGQGYRAQPSRRLNQLDSDQENVELYHHEWSARKIIDIPVDDMLRVPWEYEGLSPEDTETLKNAVDALDVSTALREALRLERLLGGCVVLMGMRDAEDDPTKPLDINTVGRGDLRFLNVIPRTRISRVSLNNNPLQPDFGRPEIYNIQGAQIHRSRLLIFDGDPLYRADDTTLTRRVQVRTDGFGVSVLNPIYDDLIRATGSRQAVFHLLHMSSALLVRTDVQSLQETNQGQARLEELEEIVNQLSIYNSAIIDSESDSPTDITTISSAFSGLADMLITPLQVLSAAADIPATRYIGQAPGGLNATGESDLENYYNGIEAKQNQRLKPQLLKLLAVLGRSTFGQQFDIRMLKLTFPPLWNLSESEMSTIRNQDATNLINFSNAAILTDDEIRNEAIERDVFLTLKQTAPDADNFTG